MHTSIYLFIINFWGGGGGGEGGVLGAHFIRKFLILQVTINNFLFGEKKVSRV